MYDRRTGRGYDGIDGPNAVNLGAGAESTIEALMAMQTLAIHPVARAYAGFVRTREAALTRLVEAEDGFPAAGSPRIHRLGRGEGQGPAGGGSYSGEAYAVLHPGDVLRWTVRGLPPGEYLVHAVLQKEADGDPGTEARVTVDGRPVGRVSSASGWRRPLLWMDRVGEAVRVGTGSIVLELGVAETEQGRLRLDALLLQPVQAYRVLEDAAGRRVRVRKDVLSGRATVGAIEEGSTPQGGGDG